MVERAKAAVTDLRSATGRAPADLGGVEAGRYVGAICLAWMLGHVRRATVTRHDAAGSDRTSSVRGPTSYTRSVNVGPFST